MKLRSTQGRRGAVAKGSERKGLVLFGLFHSRGLDAELSHPVALNVGISRYKSVTNTRHTNTFQKVSDLNGAEYIAMIFNIQALVYTAHNVSD